MSIASAPELSFGVTEQGLTGCGGLNVIARLVKHTGLGAVGEAGQGEAA